MQHLRTLLRTRRIEIRLSIKNHPNLRRIPRPTQAPQLHRINMAHIRDRLIRQPRIMSIIPRPIRQPTIRITAANIIIQPLHIIPIPQPKTHLYPHRTVHTQRHGTNITHSRERQIVVLGAGVERDDGDVLELGDREGLFPPPARIV